MLNDIGNRLRISPIVESPEQGFYRKLSLDIGIVATFKQTLWEAPSMTYPQDGASREYIEHMFERLGIAAEVKPKIVLAAGVGTKSLRG